MSFNPPRTILLAAGASVPAGIPTATDMVPKLCALLKEHDRKGWALYGALIDAVIGGLQSYRSSVRRDPFSPIDVEDLYEMLCGLRDRHRLPVTPFVGSWVPIIGTVPQGTISQLVEDAVNGLRHDVKGYVDRLGTSVERAGRFPGSGPALEGFARNLRDAMSIVAGHDTQLFSRAIEAMLRTLTALCTIQSKSVDYLAPLVTSATARPLWIATLNYDRSVELAADLAKIEYDLGLSVDGSVVEFSKGAPICLAKLHGSIDWSMDAYWRLTVGQVHSNNMALIFGSGNKLRVQGPYLDLLLAFREQLNRTNELEVCGYSFRDAHVNHMILRWLLQDETRRVHVFDPSLNVATIDANVRRVLDDQRTMTDGWLRQFLVVENIGATEWAARAP